VQNNSQNDNQYDDEINLRELFSVLWAGRLQIIAITAVFAFASVIYALSVPNQYKAVTVLAPAQSDNSDLKGTLSQMSGLASLAGVSVDTRSSEVKTAQEIMQSWSFIEGFIAENNIALEVYAAEEWSRGSNELQFDDSLYDTETKTWLIKNDNTGELGPPTSWTLFESFSEILAVSADKKTGLVTVSIEYYSPQIAKQWLDMYVAAINAHMQQRQMAKVTNNINYLEAQINKTSIAQMREIFYNIIEEQTKNKMLAEASPDYVFVTVSPSMVPEVKSQPTRYIICILGTLLGGMLSVLLVLVMHYAKKSD
tara:strand:+ start:673 stop:1605 length:933 start_codon:yes stop_codon:yes gene_type:complete